MPSVIRRGLFIDLFAGGGGASTGIKAATGRDVDIAINHSALALAVHAANHPNTLHLAADIFEVDPRTATQGMPVDALWMSPDCTHFSLAKGGQPRKQAIRSLADVGINWARDVRPKVIFLENVWEFEGWGPLHPDDHPVKKLRNRPIKERKGEDFKRWKGELEARGYVVEYRKIIASHYGAPTSRKRLFLVARCDGQPIVWPAPTHGPGLLPFHTAAECIDWSLPCPSIFDRKKPLRPKTLARIAEGIRRFVLESPAPFFATAGNGLAAPHLTKFQENSIGQDLREPIDTVMAGAPRFGLVVPTLIAQGYGERKGQSPRVLDLHRPLGTIVAQGQKHALVAAFLAAHYGGEVGTELQRPIRTVTAQDHHSLVAATLATFRGTAAGQPGVHSIEEPLSTVSAGGVHTAQVCAFLAAYYGADAAGQPLTDPVRTVTTQDRFGLVTVSGVDYQIVDIGMRMLQPHELLRAQFGRFAEGYDLSAAKTKTAKVRLIGNSVCPEAAEAVVAANLPASMRAAA